jgi:AcrR family transcriptional regulator
MGKPTPTDPRTERTRRRVLEAAFGLIRERGPAAVTYSSLAAESGVGRATIYRHWPSLETLWPDIIEIASQQMPVEQTGDLRDDLIAALGFLAERLRSPQERLQFLAILEHAQSVETSGRFLQLAQENNPLWKVLVAAVEAGSLANDTDLELATALLVGPILQRGLLSGRQTDAAFIEAVVDRFLLVEEPRANGDRPAS